MAKGAPPATPAWMEKKPNRPAPFWQTEAVVPPTLTTEQEQAIQLAQQATQLMQYRQFPPALPLLEKAAQLWPTNPDILYTLGCCHLELGQNVEALTRLKAALAFRPRWPEALNNAAAATARIGDLDDSILYAERSVAAKPSAPAYANLCSAYSGTGDNDKAIEMGEKAVALDPKSAMAWTNLGVAYRSAWRLDEAVDAQLKAIANDQKSYMPWSNLGAIKNLQGNNAEAVLATENAIMLAPYLATVRSNLVMYYDLLPTTTLEEAYAQRRAWAYAFETPAKRHWKAHTNTLDPDRKIRVGYVGADFRQHSAAHIHGPIIRNHDPEQVEVYIYAGNTNEDALSEWIRGTGTVHKWLVTSHMTDPQLAEQIRADGIDILVDVAAFTAGGRLGTFAFKPAPIQATGWGYATGTGLDSMDVFIADEVVVPRGHERGYREQIVRLPSLLCFDPVIEMPEPGPPPRERNGYVTFGSFNRVEKISDEILGAWCAVLNAVPDSRMLLKFGGLGGETEQRLRAKFAGHGIADERIEVRGNSDRATHLAAYGDVDIMLDTWPHGGGVTTLEAMLMGVPCVTLTGDRTPSRLSASILTTLGMREWVANHPGTYVEIASTKAVEDLAELRAGLPERVRKSIIGDTKSYCRAVEIAYRELWKSYCRQMGQQEAA